MAEDDLRGRAREFRTALETHHGAHGEVVFASKACPVTAVLRLFAEEGLGVDVASGGELHLALKAGFEPARIYLHGNAKAAEELRAAVEAGVGCIVVDNHEDVGQARRACSRTARASGCCCGSAPGVDADTHAAILTGHAESKFGLDPREARALAADPPAHLDVQGFHFHLGSQLNDPTPYRAAVGVLAGLGDLPVYSLGGGFAVAYTADDRPPGIERVGRRRGRGRARPARPGQAPRDRAGPLARRQRGGHALHRRVGQAAARRRAHRRRRRRDVRQSAADALRRRLRRGGRRPLRRRGRAGHRRRQALRVRATCSCAARGCRRSSPATCSSPPVTGAYGHAMASNYNGLRRPPVVFCAERRGPRRRPPRDLRGPGCPRPLASACSATAPSARRSPRWSSERAEAIARITGLRPEVCGVLTRSRGDFEDILGALGPDRGGDGRRRPGARLRAAGHARRAARRLRQQAAALPARGGAVGVRPRARRAAALRGRGRRASCRSSACCRSRWPPRTWSGSTGSSTARRTTSSPRWRAAGMSYEAALAQAQELGYAETDPTDDVTGRDAAAKMAILARLAFDTPVHLDQVRYEGIEHITPDDIAYAHQLGLGLKLIGTAERVDGGLSRARPSRVPLRRAPAGLRQRARSTRSRSSPTRSPRSRCRDRARAGRRPPRRCSAT